ncbi:hypothetical protein [Bdellovibrio sp. BCCA]|uniref:hypothetical protein n=1 Tax=Bdellovibrio sp. BCCA TaxID=3136281 RepID=UPI0030F1D135
MSKSTTYKMRAECRTDVSRMMSVVQFSDLNIKPITIDGREFPDVEVTFDSKMDLKEIISKLNKIPDGHVMAESINFLEHYDGTRRDL